MMMRWWSIWTICGHPAKIAVREKCWERNSWWHQYHSCKLFIKKLVSYIKTLLCRILDSWIVFLKQNIKMVWFINMEKRNLFIKFLSKLPNLENGESVEHHARKQCRNFWVITEAAISMNASEFSFSLLL